MKLPSLCLALGATVLAPAVSYAPETEPVVYDDLGLTLTLPELEGLKGGPKNDGYLRGAWMGKLGKSQVRIQLEVFPYDRYKLDQPDDVIRLMEINVPDKKNTIFKGTGLHEGTYGFMCYAATARADRHGEGSTRVVSNEFFLGGVLDGPGYVIQVSCKPALTGDDDKVISDFFAEGVTYKGETANLEWTDEEAIERYMKDSPEDVHNEMEKIRRTDHYIILTNSSGGKKFAQKMEEGYKKIREVFPFEEISCRKLLPVFLFQNKGEYYEFCQKVAGWDLRQAQGTKGHAWKDYYATWYEAPGDPVHIHEATHQIFANRLGLHGGGSWFQEGVAEYIETRKNDRNAAATQVKKGRAMPLRDFFQVRTLAFEGSDDVKGGNQAGDLYKTAALFIEFMRESKFGKDHFQEFVHKMGRVPRSNITRIEAVFEELYSVNIEELEEEFKTYCKRR